MKEQRRLFSPNSAATALDISRNMVYALMKAGQIKWVTIGADRRIPADEIERIAAQGASTRTAALTENREAQK